MAGPLDSPLEQQARPCIFEPKVVGLYQRLFRDSEADEKDDEFWNTLFLLTPDTARLRQVIEDTEADSLLHAQHLPQQLLLQALSKVKAGETPVQEHALETLTVFFAVVLAKKYTNPSSDIIEVLAGLDDVDSVFVDLVSTLDQAIRDGQTPEVRREAVRTAIAVVAGGYQTALVSYFVQRDFFPALMKMVYQLENPLWASEPLLLTGLLANYNKFESHNQYRMRFSDFVNEETMARVVQSIAWTTTMLRQRYIEIQDDTPVGWSMGGTLSYVGLGRLAGAKPTKPNLTEEQQKELFSQQPGGETALLLTLYDFVLANKLFRHHFVTSAGEGKSQAEHSPLSRFLSFTSYLYQHAYRNVRASLYSHLTMLILLLLVEDQNIVKALCETSSPVRMCRQRQPLLPLASANRPYVAAMIDLQIDGINHNLRKRLDTCFYRQAIAVLSSIVSHLSGTRTKLAYHWSEVWRSLLAFVRFLTQYTDDLKTLSGINLLVEGVSDVLTLSLTSGEAFLPDAAAYDDLFYKLVESGEALIKFRDAHYQELIDSHKSKGTVLTPREVSQIIKQGYETLSIETREGLDQVGKFREADYKVELKKVARVAVNDAAAWVST
ncbi:hypothetical protein DOTSEDRAFT_68345 [Dothistroma septosporum NZE10]|uniref:Armadillo-like helical domain-containing protein n=1 Tax=Dothistroma septosporum (strain NZE10 / CBS 128990) TaxID=675120 RepID=N1Q1G8_DOTSN|nr:hypothetical protein DOTSEDRAFT_68345 [Dothistroma septosporum NZE10]